jgi:hypothetical protein
MTRALASRFATIVLLLAPTTLWADAAFLRTGSLNEGRYAHAAALLPGGDVLIVGGWGQISGGYIAALASAERYDVASGAFVSAGTMAHARIEPSAAVLPSGKVLVAGGYGPVSQGGYNALASAEIYDPTTGLFSPTGDMLQARMGMTATLLVDGTVLIAGGSDATFTTLDTAEVFDETTGAFTAAGSLTQARSGHTATLLPSGDVLVAGGCNYLSCPSSNAERYDAASRTFSATGPMSVGRSNATATLLADESVLVAGGGDASGEVYDETSGTFSGLRPMTENRQDHAAALLPSGLVLVAGGNGPLSSADLFDPTTGFSPTVTMHDARTAFTATLLADSTVLVAGGAGSGPYFLASAELYHESGVEDLEPPTVNVPADITVAASDSSGAIVYFQVTASDVIDASPSVSCEPPSGSLFPVGTTEVSCIATDHAGNVSSPGTFHVTVLPPLEILITLSKGSVNTRTGVASVAGRVSCNRPVTVYLNGQLTQTIAHRGIVTGSFGTSVACSPPTSSWTATVIPVSGRYVAGVAQVSAFASACDYTCDFEQLTANVLLTGKP